MNNQIRTLAHEAVVMQPQFPATRNSFFGYELQFLHERHNAAKTAEINQEPREAKR